MSRLEREWGRLGFAQQHTQQVRALVLELKQPASPARMLEFWRAVQQDLSMPAPALAVNGSDAFAAWISLAEPVSRNQAARFIAALSARYFGDLPAGQLRIWPRVESDRRDVTKSAPFPGGTPEAPPHQQPEAGYWSAFVLPSFIEMFAQEPWLELEPGFDAQAELLSRIESITPGVFQSVAAALGLDKPVAPRHGTQADEPGANSDRAARSYAAQTDHAAELARQFLLSVVSDQTQTIEWRVKAAIALLEQSAKLDR